MSLALGLALGVVASAVHAAGVLTRQPWPLAVVSAAQLGVPVAAATLGTTDGILAPGESVALLVGALVTIAATAAVSGRVAAIARTTARPARSSPGPGGPERAAATTSTDASEGPGRAL